MKNRFKNLSGRSRFEWCGCPTASGEAGQIGLFGLAEEATAAFGCPTAFQEAAQIQFLPEGRADQGEEAGETVAPPPQPSAEAQQHVGQQGCPDLPAHGVGVVTQEIGQLQGLFEFLEEGFDAPTAAIEIGDGLGGEVFKAAIAASAAAVVLAHNHPSGDPTPSEADIKVTRDLIRAGQLLKIEVLDHVIIGRATPDRPKDYASLRELGYFYQ